MGRMKRRVCVLSAVLLFMSFFIMSCGEAPAAETSGTVIEDEAKADVSFDDRMMLIFGNEEEVPSVSADRYAYSCLSDREKKLYDIMLYAFMNYRSDILVEDTDIDTLEKVFYSVTADNGNLFWVNGYSYTGNSAAKSGNLIFSPDFTMTKEKRDAIQKEIDFAVEEWLSELPEDADDYAKSKYIYENIVERTDYDESAPDSQNIISVFLNGKSVCQGYADAAQYLLTELGIPSVIVRGKANGVPHAWNMVMLDGEWYFLDATWGNNRYLTGGERKKTVNYAYLNVTSEDLSSTHVVDMDIHIPECTAKKDNYYVREHLFFEDFEPDETGHAFSNAYYMGDEQCSVRFSNSEVYQEAFDYLIREGNLGLYCEGLSTIYYNERHDMLVLTVYFREGD